MAGRVRMIYLGRAGMESDHFTICIKIFVATTNISILSGVYPYPNNDTHALGIVGIELPLQ